MTLLFRRAKAADLDAIHHLATQSGVGLTTLLKDRALLNLRLTQSNASFDKLITAPQNEYYLFVLEDPTTHHVAGTAAIEAMTGVDAPFYSYQRATSIHTCPSLDIQREHDYLTLVHDNEHRTEVCTLYLEPAYRQNGNGLLLSLARFLFMAQYPERFAPIVIAEMRGFSDEQGRSPFWDAVGYPFFDMSFAKADQLTLSNKQFIADLMPKYPIYLHLLPKAAQEVIGRAHPSTLPAMKMLTREGFQYNQYIDIFDAGPTLEIALNKIRTIAQSKLFTINITRDDVGPQRALLANTDLCFRATLGKTKLDHTNKMSSINPEIAHLLQLKDGDLVRISVI